jgi:hypothetical protein
LAALAVALALSQSLAAAEAQLGGFSDREDGISCSYFDVGVGAVWRNNKPAWLDADLRPNGPRGFATERVAAGDLQRVRRLDVTTLVRAWWTGQINNQGLLLRLSEGELVNFHAREQGDGALRPQLRLRAADGRVRFVEAVADAALDCSTFKGLGRAETLTLRHDVGVAIRFDLQASKLALGAAAPLGAELVLVRTPDVRPGALRLEVMALDSPLGRPAPPRVDGIARRYPLDAGIAGDADVWFADTFDCDAVDARWSPGMRAPHELVNADTRNGFVPLAGRALKVTIPRGQQVGLDLRYRFASFGRDEPEEAYFRYYLRLARDWLKASDGGKLPGFAGTYGRAGWGGRRWDGGKGWSLRGSYGIAPGNGHAATGKVVLGSYAYHAGSQGMYGEGLTWLQSGLAGLIEPERWYCIEQRVKLNAPGRADGELEVWVDGRLALSRKDLRLRDLPTIRIEEVWMNFFHGGVQPAPVDMHAFVDALVVARRYIGPMAH